MRSWVTHLLLIGFLAAPLASAQVPLDESGAATRVDQCARQCAPQDEDVNGAAVKSGASSVRTILYGHFQDILNRAPLNTQPPGDQESDLNRGFTMPTVTAYTPAEPGYVHFENNWFYMFSSPGFVEIVDGQWRTHQEPGLAERVQVVGDTITLYFYLSAYPVPGMSSSNSPTGGTAVDVLPQIGIYARMETGRHPFSSKSILIAEGDTGADDTAALPTGSGRATLVTAPGQADVFEFQVPMQMKVPYIPSVWDGAEGYLVSVNPYQISEPGVGTDEQTQVTQPDWRVRAGPSTPPRIVLDVANPLVTKNKEFIAFREHLFVRWSFASPWGSYDTDDRRLSIHVEGPGDIPPEAIQLVIIKRSVDHDGHFKPINVTWKIDHVHARMPDGEYTVHTSIPNLQRSYELRETWTFRMHEGAPLVDTIGAAHHHTDKGGVVTKEAPTGTVPPEGGDSPATGLVAAVVAASAALAVARRRVR